MSTAKKSVQGVYPGDLLTHAIWLSEQSQFDAAIATLDTALQLKPDWVEALICRGTAKAHLKNHPAALIDLNKAVELEPINIIALCNLGGTQCELGLMTQAIATLGCVIDINPDNVFAHYNTAVAFMLLGQRNEAMRFFAKTATLDPTHGAAHWNMALIHLLEGDFKKGWPLHEWRWQKDHPMRPGKAPVLRQPRWTGAEAIAQKTLFVYAEQGLGDTLQFSRYVWPLLELGCHVILGVQPALVGLLQNSVPQGVKVIGTGHAIPRYDLHCPLLSLPLALEARLSHIPSQPSYLHPTTAYRDKWAARLGAGVKLQSKPRVGLVWQGDPRHSNDRHRSIALNQLLACASADVDFVSLQKEVAPTDAALLEQHADITLLGSELNDYQDTAAACLQLDLVITVDTSVAHLAAALGRPTWVLLAFNPDWRWRLEGQDSAWYPSVRLFRQPQPGDWASVVAQVKAALAQVPWPCQDQPMSATA